MIYFASNTQVRPLERGGQLFPIIQLGLAQ